MKNALATAIAVLLASLGSNSFAAEVNQTALPFVTSQSKLPAAASQATGPADANQPEVPAELRQATVPYKPGINNAVLDISGSAGFVSKHFQSNTKYIPGSTANYDYLIVDGSQAGNYRAQVFAAFEAGKRVIFDTNGTQAGKDAMAASVFGLLGSSINCDALMVSYIAKNKSYALTPIDSPELAAIKAAASAKGAPSNSLATIFNQ